MSLSLYVGAPADGAAKPVIRTVEGQTGVTLTFAMKNSDGTAHSLAGYANAYLSAECDGTWHFDLADLTIAAGVGGTCSIVPSAAQVATVGRYSARIRLVTAAGAVTYSEPFIIDVQENGESGSSVVGWTSIAITGDNGTSPLGHDCTELQIVATVESGSVVTAYYRLRLEIDGAPEFFNRIAGAVAYGTTLYSYMQVYTTAAYTFTLDFFDVVLADGTALADQSTGIQIDISAYFGGAYYVYTPEDLNGSAGVGDPPDSDIPEIEET